MRFIPLLLSGLIICLPASAVGTHNDQIYPPAPAAKSLIDYDGKGFLINGQRTVITSGSVHYARVPRELWPEILLRLKRGGFNTVQTYAFWNFHEEHENEFNFSGDHDLGAFLDAAQKLGLNATVRVGPYVCAEWDSGGYPVWLRFKPNVQLRSNTPEFLALSDHWYEKIIPLVAQHQINHGGNVILVQLENEHSNGWGVVNDDPYFVHLHDKAKALGLEVPFWMSGLNHGGSPAPGNLDPSKRTNPWYTTEFWAGWFDAYRTLPAKKYLQINHAQWQNLAHGGGGYNFYMLFGGTNFDHWSDDSTGASYDYGAAIGQAGDLRLMYYRMKRVNLLAQSFPDILANDTDASSTYNNTVKGAGVSILGARQSDQGAFVFLENNQPREETAQFSSGETLRLAKNSIYPIPHDVVLTDGVKISDGTLPVLALAHHRGTATLVVYGQPGDTGRITLQGNLTPGAASANFTVHQTGEKTELKIKIPDQGVTECALRNVRVLAINQDLSLYTWLIGDKDQQDLVFGPAFVQDLQEAAGKMTVTLERPYGQPGSGQVAVYGAQNQEWHLAVSADTSLDAQPAPTLDPWQMRATMEQQLNFDDSTWKQSPEPLEMGADGDDGAFAWYRATINVPTAGPGKLRLKGGDELQVYLNGQSLGKYKQDMPATFTAGANVIAVLASHHGRNKVFSYYGALDARDTKGLTGPAYSLIGGQTTEITGWKMRGGLNFDPAKATSWGPVRDTQGAAAFYQTSFTAHPPAALGAHPILRVTFAGLGRGTVWLNGHNLGQYPEKIRIDGLYLPECWLVDGTNQLTIFDTAGANPSQVKLYVETAASREVIQTSTPTDPATPMIVPQENPIIDFSALNKDNIAFQAQATASVNSPALALTDGDLETSWTGAKEAWVALDLGKVQVIKTCEISWGSPAKTYKYTLEGSLDGQQWTQLGDETTAVPTSPDSPSELSRLNLSGASYRYLRVTIHEGKTFDIAEIKAFAH